MSLDEETLEVVAQNGEMKYEKWPAIVEPLLERLNYIAYNEFLIPRPYKSVTQPLSSPTQTQTNSAIDQTQTSTSISQTPSTPIRNLPPVPPFPTSSATSTTHIPDSLPPSQPPSFDQSNELPTLLLQILNGVSNTIRASFAENPPHTIQRLAELVLNPTKHYKTLPAWLRAVDRVVSVSSSANIFPLSDQPPLVNGVNGNTVGGILWTSNSSESTRNGYDSAGLGSDESLGGALLTPISWLRNGVSGQRDSEDSNDLEESLGDGDDGLGDPIDLHSGPPSGGINYGISDPLVPEREGGAVTQGELIRMEQEAGVVPVSHDEQSAPNRTMVGIDDEIQADDEELTDSTPRARGPDLLDAVDVGRVDGKDVSVHLGSPPKEVHDAFSDSSSEESSNRGKDEEADSAAGISDLDSFEIVNKDIATDEMQLDDKTEGYDKTVGKSQNTQDKTENDIDDNDIVLVDADGKTEDEAKADSSGENIGPDAADTSTIT